MKVAALYDIHGNAPALEAVLREAPADALVVIGGDIALGPQPVETLQLLDAIGDRARWIRGNCEGPTAHTDQVWRDRSLFTVERMGEERRRRLEKLPATVTIDVDGLGATLFCHGSPRSDEEIITAVTSEQRLRGILAGVRELTVVCGHTHHQFDRTVDGIRVINAGSIGMPYEGRPGAYWALLGPDVDLRRTNYDFGAAAEAVLASGYPNAAEHAETLFKAPPTAAEAAEHFEGHAVEKEAS
jgi:predicted phosphodiesterase